MARLYPPPADGEVVNTGLDDALRNGAGPNPDSGIAYAGLVTRAIAIVVDAVLIDGAAFAVTGAVLLVESVFAPWPKHHTLALTAGGALFFIWVISYFAVFWTTTGQTPGGRVMQIRVTRADGTRLRPRHAFVRLAGMVLSLPFFWGYLPMLWSARRRTVFDVLAGTVVTERPSVSGTDQGGDSGRVSHSHASGIAPASTVP